MLYSTARDAIVRKFTNYRNHNKHADSREARKALALKEVGEKLVNLKSSSRGKRLFKLQHQDTISAQQTELLTANPKLLPVVAYQKAVKFLWEKEDEDHWEALAETELSDEIYKYNIYFRNYKCF